MCDKKKILLVLTGGTICSFANGSGEQASDSARAGTLIADNFKKGDSPYKNEVEFETLAALNVLSENMTVARWQELLAALKGADTARFDGIIILHGTDTLAYTASLLSVMLAGTDIPVMLVSANRPLYDKSGNGNDNFAAAISLIYEGIAPNVYAVYKNKDGLYLHYGAHLLQCAPHSDEFFSKTMMRIGEHSAHGFRAGEMLLYNCPPLKDCVMLLCPYVGLDYSRIRLDGVRAVLHPAYHSGTLATDTGDMAHSALLLKERCDACGADLFIYPCEEDAAYRYETTGALIRAGVFATMRMSVEMTYAKLVVGCSMGLSGDALQRFVNTEINGEFIY